MPIILFFFGYSHGTDDPIRFILTSYPAFFIAIAACGIWKNVERRDLPFLLLIALGWYLTIPNPTTANYSFYLEQPLHLIMRNCDFVWFDIGGFLCIVTGVAVLTWRNRQTGVFLALVNLLYLLGNAYILALMLGRRAAPGDIRHSGDAAPGTPPTSPASSRQRWDSPRAPKLAPARGTISTAGTELQNCIHSAHQWPTWSASRMPTSRSTLSVIAPASVIQLAVTPPNSSRK